MQSLLKFVHVFGVVLFLGNISVTFYWKIMANRTRDMKIISFSQKQVTKTDFVFTGLGATLIAISGYSMVGRTGFDLSTPWILWAQILFYLSALIWLFFLVPIQYKQWRLVDSLNQSKFNETKENEFYALSQRWNVIGSLALALPMISLFLMTLKPKF